MKFTKVLLTVITVAIIYAPAISLGDYYQYGGNGEDASTGIYFRLDKRGEERSKLLFLRAMVGMTCSDGQVVVPFPVGGELEELGKRVRRREITNIAFLAVDELEGHINVSASIKFCGYGLLESCRYRSGPRRGEFKTKFRQAVVSIGITTPDNRCSGTAEFLTSNFGKTRE